MNAEIRLLHFNQGVDLDSPPTGDIGGKVTLNNNASNTIDGITLDLTKHRCLVATCYLYRRVDGGTFKWMRVDLELMALVDGATNADKFAKSESYRKESQNFGLTITLDTSVANKATAVMTLDNMAGAGHDCKLYYKINSMLA